nr:MAG: nonstructural polyprotein [Picornavirales sp.]
MNVIVNETVLGTFMFSEDVNNYVEFVKEFRKVEFNGGEDYEEGLKDLIFGTDICRLPRFLAKVFWDEVMPACYWLPYSDRSIFGEANLNSEVDLVEQLNRMVDDLSEDTSLVKRTLLKLSGDIESNPGPVVIPKMGVTVCEQNNIMKICLANGGIILVYPHQYEEDKVEIKLNVSYRDEEAIRAVVSRTRSKGKTVAAALPLEKLQDYYSSHNNFQPSKRIVVKSMSTTLQKLGHTYPLQYSEGAFSLVGNFNFIPKNCLRIKIDKNWLLHQYITPTKYEYCLNSVRNQEMTKEQLIEYASLCTTVQMFYLSTKHMYSEYVTTYYSLFQITVDRLEKMTRLVISAEEAWNMLLELKQVHIPTTIIEFKEESELTAVEGLVVPMDPPSYNMIAALQLASEEYDYTGSKEKIIEDYKLGMTRSKLAVIPTLRFDFKDLVPEINMYLRSEDYELNKYEQFVKLLVERRLTVGDFTTAAATVLEEMEDLDEVIEMVKLLSAKVYSYTVTTNLQRMLGRNLKSRDPDEIRNLSDHELSYKLFEDEYLVARRMQLEFQIFLQEFGKQTRKNVFNTANNLRKVFMMRYSKTINVANENETYWGTAKRKFTEVKEFIQEAYDTKKTMAEINDLWNSKKDSVIELLNMDTNSGLGAKLVQSVDFSTFNSSWASGKMVIDVIFTSTMSTILGFFGVPFENQFPASTTLMYYLIWKNTTNVTLQYMLLMDILAQIGIVDVAIAILRTVGSTVSKLWEKMTINVAFSDEDLDAIINSQESKAEDFMEKATAKLDTLPKDDEEEHLSTWDKIMQVINSQNVTMIGAVAVAIGFAFKLKPSNYSYDIVGKNIVETMKNLSIVGGALLMVPRVYQMLLAIFKWILDQLKSMVCKNHKTVAQLNAATKNWLRAIAPFIPGSCLKSLSRSPNLCVTWLMLNEEFNVLNRETYRMDRDLRHVFASQSKIFQSRHQKVHVALINMCPAEEIFHVQFASEPGCGKTDASQQMARELQAELGDMRVQIGKTIKGPVGNALISKALLEKTPILDKYSYNENLKYMDGYVGQAILYADDVNVFTNTPAENIVQQMYICSGNTVQANMADLDEKGIPITSKILISNTNNPFPKFDHMYTPEALWRRRILVKATLDPRIKYDFKKPGGKNLNELINEFYRVHGGERTSSKHLVFSVMHSTEENRVHKEGRTKMEGLTFPQLKRYLISRYKLHISTEWDRVVSKSPIMAKLGAFYEAIQKNEAVRDSIKLEANTPENLLKRGVDIVKTYYDKIVTDQLEKDFEKLLAESKATDAQKKDYMQYVAGDRDCAVEFLEDYNEGFDLDEALGAIDVNERMVNYMLDCQENDGKKYYSLIASEQPVCYTNDGGDWTRISEGVVDAAGLKTKKYMYKSDEKLTDRDYQAVLGMLYDLETIVPFARKATLAHRKRKMLSVPFKASYLSEIKYYLVNVVDKAYSTAKWLYEKVVKEVGKSLMNGVLTMFGIMGVFFAAAVIGNLFGTSDTSYNQHGKGIYIPGISKKKAPGVSTINVSSEIPEEFSRVKRSCFKVQAGGSSFQMLAYQGNIFIVPSHGMENVKLPATLLVSDPSTSQEVKSVEILKRHYKVIPNTDYGLLYLPQFRPVKSLRSKWISETELNPDMISLRHVGASVISIRERSNLADFSACTRDFYVTPQRTLYTPGYEAAYGLHKRRVLALPGAAKRGDSGSVVLHHSNHLPSSILGIVHRTNQAMMETFVAVVSREDIDAAVKEFEFEAKIEVRLHEVDEVADHRFKEVFKFNQIVKPSPYRDQSVDTGPGFKKTPFYSNFPVSDFPAGQRADDPRFPPGSRHFLEVSLNKSAGVKTVLMTHEEGDFGMKYLKAIYTEFVPEVHQSVVFSTSQAITGIKALGSTSIDVTTSAGLPYKEEKGVVGKTPMISFNKELNTWMIQDRVRMDVELYENNYINGKCPGNMKVEFRKHELVGESKFLEPKTRTVGTGNFVQQIVYMKLFKDFFTQVKNVWMLGRSCPFATGVDPEKHWNQIVTHLRWTDYMVDFDVKAWEEKMNQYVMNLTAKVRLDILRRSMESQNLPWNTDYEKIAYALIVDYIHTDVVFEDIVYTKRAGLLSGHPGTFMENSEVHEIVLGVACWKILLKYRREYATIPFIIENIRSVKAADDIVIAISPIAREYVTVERLVLAYKELGYDLTAPDKSPVISAKTIHEIQFLKNGFREEDGRFYMIPNESQIYRLITWVRSKTANSLENQIRINLNTALRFAFWRGREFYEEIRDKLNLLCAKMHMGFSWSATYEEMACIIKLNNEDDVNRFYTMRAGYTDEDLMKPVDEIKFIK